MDFSVTEGVMGYYDGVGISCEKSTWTVSKETGTPTILIFNVKGMSHTMIPLIKGMIEYQDNPVAGVILNRCSKGMYQLMKPEIEEKLGISVVGYFPQKEGIYIGSRHLGLMTAAEIDNLDEILSLLGETAEECIDLDLLLEIGEKAEPLTAVKRQEVPAEKRAKIAVAWDISWRRLSGNVSKGAGRESFDERIYLRGSKSRQADYCRVRRFYVCL